MVRNYSTLFVAAVSFVACSQDDGASPLDAGRPPIDATFEKVIDPDGPSARFCDLPGSVQFTSGGVVEVSGGSGAERIAFLQLPQGFCAHYFGSVGNTRQLRFAPSGELFVASPTTGTTGGGPGGQGAIIILTDDDLDGVADAPITFLSGLPSTQGIMFAKDFFYYQNATKILRRPYTVGDRHPSDPVEQVVDITAYSSSGHWPKPLDQADDGTIYVGNGGDQGENCDPSHPFHGGILKLDGTLGGRAVSRGFRNPIAVRCQRGHNRCFAVELAMDFSAEYGGREKLVPIREGDDWGYPCCFTKGMAAPNISPLPDCSGVTAEDVSFLIGDTPFGVDFEPGKWAPPYSGAAFVPVHGAYGSWTGARLVVIDVDPATGLPRPGSNLPNVSNGAMGVFATGWDDGTHAHGRPSAVAFAADGRLFVGNDNNGDIFWIAPLDLER
jgi:glucose/arabinose dehydrogenase